MKTLKLTQGFTLIELLIVVLIISVMVLIAKPQSPCGYIVRSQVTEGLALAASAKTIVAENIANGLAFDTGWKAPNATKNVSSKPNPALEDFKTNTYSGIAINPANGIITVSYSNNVGRKGLHTLLLIPIVNAKDDKPSTGELPAPGIVPKTGILSWQCHSATAPEGDTFPQLLGTIDPCYVPANCRYIAPPTAWERFLQKLRELSGLN